MRLSTKIGLAGAGMLVSVAVYAASCPVDNSSARFTGKTATDKLTGTLMYEHECPRGHKFWTTSSS